MVCCILCLPLKLTKYEPEKQAGVEVGIELGFAAMPKSCGPRSARIRMKHVMLGMDEKANMQIMYVSYYACRYIEQAPVKMGIC